MSQSEANAGKKEFPQLDIHLATEEEIKQFDVMQAAGPAPLQPEDINPPAQQVATNIPGIEPDGTITGDAQ